MPLVLYWSCVTYILLILFLIFLKIGILIRLVCQRLGIIGVKSAVGSQRLRLALCQRLGGVIVLSPNVPRPEWSKLTFAFGECSSWDLSGFVTMVSRARHCGKGQAGKCKCVAEKQASVSGLGIPR